jgi:hypothetical protein
MKNDRVRILFLVKDKNLKKLYGKAKQLYYLYRLPNIIRYISVAYVNDVIVGVSVLTTKFYQNTFQIYVNPEFRNNKIGAKLTENLKPYFDNEKWYIDENNIQFFKKMRMENGC